MAGNQDKTFGIVDYIIIAGTLGISILIGIYYAFIKKQTTNEDMLVGGRKMTVFPIALSLLASYLSAILVLGFTGEVYSTGMVILGMGFAAIVIIPFVGFLFLPTLYNLRLTSVYEYLELRFESRAVRLIATATFITQIVLYTGVVVFAPALALNVVGEFPIWISILAIGGSAGIYTAIGGIKAVVWTDVFQAFMMFSGMLAMIIQGSINVGGLGEAWRIAEEHGRLQFFEFSFDPFVRHTSFGVFFGLGTFWASGYGCHQTTVQRYCSMPSLRHAFTALLCTGPLIFFTVTLALLSGVVIFANYAGCDPLSLGLIKRPDQIAPHFVLEHLTTPGLLGLFNACLLSGALSTVSSGLNSLAAVTWEDFLKNMSMFQDYSESKKGLVVKGIGFFYALVTIAMGFIASNLGGVLSVALIVNGAVNGPLLGVFVLGVIIPFVNKYGAMIGMLVAHCITLWIAFGSLAIKRPVPTLPFRIDECSPNITSSLNMTEVILRQTKLMTPPPDLEWPEKIYTISYTLQPLIGFSTTILVGVIVSLITGTQALTKNGEKYIHPWIVWFYRKVQRTIGISEFEMEDKRISPNTNSNKSDGMYRNGYNSRGGGGNELTARNYRRNDRELGNGHENAGFQDS